MNHSQLRAFHAVAQEGGFTNAAKVLEVVTEIRNRPSRNSLLLKF